jgi:antitoxin (DNA-binding transcriptional repressor) of toxin-antitoxin stability system
MAIVTIRDARTSLSCLVKRAENGEQITMARGKAPVARLVALTPSPKKRTPGRLKGKPRVGRELFKPISTEEL